MLLITGCGSAVQSDEQLGTQRQAISIDKSSAIGKKWIKLGGLNVVGDATSEVLDDQGLFSLFVAARLTASAAGNSLYCPEFSLDESAMVASETGNDMGKAYGVKWTGGTASEPELLLESGKSLEVWAFSL